MVVTNHLLSGMILQVPPFYKKTPVTTPQNSHTSVPSALTATPVEQKQKFPLVQQLTAKAPEN